MWSRELVRTRALSHLIIGIDDTDSREGGATFALALALLQYPWCNKRGDPDRAPCRHAQSGCPMEDCGEFLQLYRTGSRPRNPWKRWWNGLLLFVGDEALSAEWGIAVKQGFRIDPLLRSYGRRVRDEIVSSETAQETAGNHGITLHGGRGVIGALAAVTLSGLPNEILLNPERTIPL